ncbi:RNA signal recognition particle [Candidatus Nomurabacteria bacterium RIFCSPLOWO2_01_FULL_41_21]|uniref:RNA signal recognition particle n=2 Tax=Candidatus Nomuraibacteriota TaxID=1752729 RepID=A0A1F6V262_9BACT|nr:MAG: RNA signal recognition particle [Candidatus Nomurabacteria bacterium RIFCSPHIGHO2_01_FULL_40_20]OGI87917.1 MAG: RNA signal recognition particle [Candidatus Nomurabacteria bacterium RIFCSPLOWO2_01_FULL_41_21]
MAKTNYVDGFVLVVPKKKFAEYKKMAQEASKMWKKFGALDYKECVIEDTKPPMVTFTFPKMIKAKPGEQVWFSYIEYKSRAHRDQVNKKVMALMDKEKDKYKNMQMPFDMKRMAYGGFKVVVDA